MRIKRFLSIILIMTVSLSGLSGCGNKGSIPDEEDIELVYPVGVTENIISVERRDLINYKVYSGKIVPKVMEYAFSSDKTFLKYGILPGSSIKAGEAIAYSATKALDDQIENLEKEIVKDRENYNESMEELRETLAAAKSQEAYWKQIVENCENMNEAERKAYTDGGMKFDEAYASYRDSYARKVASRERTEENIKEKSELFELDSSYKAGKLTRLKKQRDDNMVISGMDGTVVAINYLYENDYVSKNYSVGAVGDFNRLLLKCDAIPQSDIKRAEEVYAIIDGKRYELVYAPEDKSSEYDREITASGNSYSTFEVVDPEKIIKSGDFATVVVVSKSARDVMCLPTEAINKNDEGEFVYVKEDEEIRSVYIKTGMKSGLYTEIESGIMDTDRIVSEFRVPETSSVSKVTAGSVSSQFSETGYLYYSKQDSIKNVVDNGTVYIQEVCVKQYERVAKGQVLARISVTGDSIALGRLERSLLRMNETLNEYIKESETENAKLIKHQRENIAELEKRINDMKADFAKTEIVAPYDGIMTYVNWFEEGDILLRDATFGTIAEEANCYVVVEDPNGQLNYGNEARVEYRDATGATKTAVGTVVTVAACSLSGQMQTGYSLISVPAEDLTVMASVNQGNDGWWMRAHFNVKVTIRSVDNVLLIPKRGVKNENNVTYAIVKDENGNNVYRSFIAGGSDNNNYWVISGLTEGQEICLE